MSFFIQMIVNIMISGLPLLLSYFSAADGMLIGIPIIVPILSTFYNCGIVPFPRAFVSILPNILFSLLSLFFSASLIRTYGPGIHDQEGLGWIVVCFLIGTILTLLLFVAIYSLKSKK